jgi:hypothetical protein
MNRLVVRWLDSPWAFELLPGLNKLGRNPENDFRLSDPSVSSFHAEIMVEHEAITIRDLGSTNGTFLDEQRIQEAPLHPEIIIRLGNIRLQMDRVQVTPLQQVEATGAALPTKMEVAGGCMYHTERRAAYKCENCGGSFCSECVAVMGKDRYGTTTLCPVCKAQCYPLPSPAGREPERSTLMTRLTQTLRIPFGRS